MGNQMACPLFLDSIFLTIQLLCLFIDTGWVHKGGTQVYDTPGTEATGVCQNYLHTNIATLDDMNNVFENNP